MASNQRGGAKVKIYYNFEKEFSDIVSRRQVGQIVDQLLPYF